MPRAQLCAGVLHAVPSAVAGFCASVDCTQPSEAEPTVPAIAHCKASRREGMVLLLRSLSCEQVVHFEPAVQQLHPIHSRCIRAPEPETMAAVRQQVKLDGLIGVAPAVDQAEPAALQEEVVGGN